MEKTKVFVCGCLTGFVSVIGVSLLFGDTFFLLIPAGLAVALAIGYLARLWPLAIDHKPVMTVAIFCGGLVAVAPIIVVTYGFALVLLVPLLVIWSVTVLLGTLLGNRVKS